LGGVGLATYDLKLQKQYYYKYDLSHEKLLLYDLLTLEIKFLEKNPNFTKIIS